MPRAKKAKPTKTLINYIVDESSSMSGIADQVRTGFNEYIDEVKKNAEGSVFVTLTRFNTTEQTDYVAKPIEEVGEILYIPGGMTALYDAVANTVKRVESQVDDDTTVITVIMTDGQDNSSREATEKDVSALVTAKQDTGRWTFVFLGADRDAWEQAQRLGLYRGNTIAYASSGTSRVMANLANATVTRSNTAYSGGASATTDFFVDANQTEEDYKNDTDSN